jgi:hypothetical protein
MSMALRFGAILLSFSFLSVEPAAAECGDVNADGSVRATDALMVLKSAVGQDAGMACARGEAASIEERMTAIESLLAHFVVEGDTMVLSGMNLQIVDGTGSSGPDEPRQEPNGLGNLIIGYDEPAPGTPPDEGEDDVDKTGSHNLVIGAGHTYTSFGGIVAGDANTITAESASVLGGTGNAATGTRAVVVAGSDNEAAGERAAILGGSSNTVSGSDAVVSGGTFNRAFGEDSAVSGGLSNDAQGFASSVSGGEFNRAFGPRSSVSGGSDNVADGVASSVTGGSVNRANGFTVAVSGGRSVVASGSSTWAAGTLTEGE